jgi:hypothetical protein
MPLPANRPGYARGACYSNFFHCIADPGNIGIGTIFHVGDMFTTWVFWTSIEPFPNFQLSTPDGVTLSQVSPVPLPASWLLFASALGLGGLFRRWRRAHA